MSAEDNETMADICQKIRYGGFPDLADHIERVWKRERDMLIYSFDPTKAAKSLAPDGSAYALKALEHPQSTPIGNPAAMREALEIAQKAICHHAKYICQSLAWENCTINANCGDILCAHRDLCEAKTAILKALAAPPRNCDLFGGDYKMLYTAWFDWTGSPSGCAPDGTVKMLFGEWLLAPAQKGGAK